MNDRGFAVFESMIAVLIMGLVLVICLNAVSFLLNKTETVYNLNIAAMFGQQIISKSVWKSTEKTGAENDLYEEYPGFRRVTTTDSKDIYKDRLLTTIHWKESGKEKEAKFVSFDIRKK